LRWLTYYIAYHEISPGNIQAHRFCCPGVAPERAMPRKILTDRMIKALKPAMPGARSEHRDAIVPGLAVRVTDRAHKSFVLLARYPGSPNPTRRSLGKYGAITLEEVRDKARDWLQLIQAGRDPAIVEEEKRQAAERVEANTFATAAEQFVKHIHRQKLRSVAVMERDLRQVFVARWKKQPITDITADDIKTVIREAVDRGAKYRAFKLFALIRRLLNWAIGTDDYGLESNPCRRLKPRDLIGERHARDRVLTNDELRALWRVTRRIGYPYGPLYRLLILTGLRLNEVSGAEWNEFDRAATMDYPARTHEKSEGWG
jgi:hypothetical protein